MAWCPDAVTFYCAYTAPLRVDSWWWRPLPPSCRSLSVSVSYRAVLTTPARAECIRATCLRRNHRSQWYWGGSDRRGSWVRAKAESLASIRLSAASWWPWERPRSQFVDVWPWILNQTFLFPSIWSSRSLRSWACYHYEEETEMEAF